MDLKTTLMTFALLLLISTIVVILVMEVYKKVSAGAKKWVARLIACLSTVVTTGSLWFGLLRVGEWEVLIVACVAVYCLQYLIDYVTLKKYAKAYMKSKLKKNGYTDEEIEEVMNG